MIWTRLLPGERNIWKVNISIAGYQNLFRFVGARNKKCQEPFPPLRRENSWGHCLTLHLVVWQFPKEALASSACAVSLLTTAAQERDNVASEGGYEALEI